MWIDCSNHTMAILVAEGIFIRISGTSSQTKWGFVIFLYLVYFCFLSSVYNCHVFYSSPCKQGHSAEMMVSAYDLGLQLSWAGEIWKPWVFIARTQFWDDGQCIWAGEIWRPWVFIGSYMFEYVGGQHTCMICLMCSLNEAYVPKTVATYFLYMFSYTCD